MPILIRGRRKPISPTILTLLPFTSRFWNPSTLPATVTSPTPVDIATSRSREIGVLIAIAPLVLILPNKSRTLPPATVKPARGVLLPTFPASSTEPLPPSIVSKWIPSIVSVKVMPPLLVRFASPVSRTGPPILISPWAAVRSAPNNTVPPLILTEALFPVVAIG